MFTTTSAQGILEKFSGLKIQETRKRTEEYVEVVFLSQDLRAWEEKLNEFLGEPLKKAFKKASREALAVSKSLGSVQFEQTLYLKIFDEVVLVVMLWPWQDKKNITLKIACIKKK